MDSGWLVIETGTITTKPALAVLRAPHVLLITQSYSPPSDTLVEAIVSVSLVAPGMSEPPLRH
jgi:hypothetical protein